MSYLYLESRIAVSIVLLLEITFEWMSSNAQYVSPYLVLYIWRRMIYKVSCKCIWSDQRENPTFQMIRNRTISSGWRSNLTCSKPLSGQLHASLIWTEYLSDSGFRVTQLSLKRKNEAEWDHWKALNSNLVEAKWGRCQHGQVTTKPPQPPQAIHF